jgi:hypothetical protein
VRSLASCVVSVRFHHSNRLAEMMCCAMPCAITLTPLSLADVERHNRYIGAAVYLI